MQLRRIFRVASILSAGLIATHLRDQDFLKWYDIQDLCSGLNVDRFHFPTIEVPKAYAQPRRRYDDYTYLSPKYINQRKRLDNTVSNAFHDLQNDCNFLQHLKPHISHHKIEYSDYFMFYDYQRKCPYFTYEYVDKRRINGQTYDNLNWKYDEDIDPKHQAAYNPDPETYDRGHMAARGNHTLNKHHQKETYMYTNVGLQTKVLNGGLWKELEHFARDLVQQQEYKGVHIFSGPVWDKEAPKLVGRHKIPKHYFKIIITEPSSNGQPRTMSCFLLPNSAKAELKKGELGTTRGANARYDLTNSYTIGLDKLEEKLNFGFQSKHCDLKKIKEIAVTENDLEKGYFSGKETPLKVFTPEEWENITIKLEKRRKRRPDDEYLGRNTEKSGPYSKSKVMSSLPRVDPTPSARTRKSKEDEKCSKSCCTPPSPGENQPPEFQQKPCQGFTGEYGNSGYGEINFTSPPQGSIPSRNPNCPLPPINGNIGQSNYYTSPPPGSIPSWNPYYPPLPTPVPPRLIIPPDYRTINVGPGNIAFGQNNSYTSPPQGSIPYYPPPTSTVPPLYIPSRQSQNSPGFIPGTNSTQPSYIPQDDIPSEQSQYSPGSNPETNSTQPPESRSCKGKPGRIGSGRFTFK